jgi:hypothetical protein
MVSRPRDLADRMSGRRKADDGYLRETFTLPRDKARTKARDFLTRYPKAGYMTAVERARASRRRDRVHHAPAAQRRLARRAADGSIHGTFPATPGINFIHQPYRIVNIFRS